MAPKEKPRIRYVSVKVALEDTSQGDAGIILHLGTNLGGLEDERAAALFASGADTVVYREQLFHKTTDRASREGNLAVRQLWYRH